MTPSATYCPFPWIAVNVLPKAVSPCCHWAYEETSGIVDFDAVRNSMMKGERIPNCAQCYHDEDNGKKSRRVEYIEKYGVTYDTKLKLLDISFDNLCNLKCRGCVSANSHLIFDDEKELYGDTFAEKKYISSHYHEQLDYSGITEITISGGEPLLSKRAEEFMYRLLKEDRLKNVFLGMSTNCTVPPSEKWLEIFNSVRELSLTLSIDGYGKINNYFRSRADFDTSAELMKIFKDVKDKRTGKTHIQLHTTVSVYNINLLDDIEKFTEENFPSFNHTRRLLMWPSYFSIKHLPKEYKQMIRPIVESYYDEEILNFLDEDGEDYFEHFLNAHDKLDLLRQESLKEANPMFYEYIEKYRSEHPKRTSSKTFFMAQFKGLKA